MELEPTNGDLNIQFPMARNKAMTYWVCLKIKHLLSRNIGRNLTSFQTLLEHIPSGNLT